MGVKVDQSKTLHRYVDGNQVVDVLTPEDGKPRNQVTPNTKLLTGLQRGLLRTTLTVC